MTGNTVITAARVEQLNKEYGPQMIITEESLNAIKKNDFKGDPQMKAVKIKGRSNPVTIIIMKEEVKIPQDGSR